MIIRRYLPTDRQAVVALGRRLQIGVADWRDRQAVAKAASEWLRQSIEDPDTAVIVAVARDNEVCGVATVGTKTHFTGEVDAYVGELVVSEDQEGSGVGRSLMRAAEAEATSRGCRCVTLETGAANQGARAFYRALGYLEEDLRLTRVIERSNETGA